MAASTVSSNDVNLGSNGSVCRNSEARSSADAKKLSSDRVKRFSNDRGHDLNERFWSHEPQNRKDALKMALDTINTNLTRAP